MALWMDNSSVVKSDSSPNFDGAGSGIAFFETAADAGDIYDDDFESSFFNFKSKPEIYTPPHDSFESNLFDSFSATKQEQASTTTDDDTLFGESSFVSDLVNFVKVEPDEDLSRSSSPEFPINMFDLNDIDVDQQQHNNNNNPFDIDMKPLENMFISADDNSFNDFGNVSLEDFGLNNVKDDFNFTRSVITAEEEKLLNEFCLDYLFRNDVNAALESADDPASVSIKVKEEDDSAAIPDNAESREVTAAPLISNYGSVKEEPVVEDFDNDVDSFFDVNDQINWIPATTAGLPKATTEVTINSNDNDEPLSGITNKQQDGCGSVLLSKVAGESAISSVPRQHQQQNRHQKVTVVVNKNARSILAANGSSSSVGNKNGDGKSFQRVVICSKKPQHQLTAASGIKSVSGKIVIQKPQSDTTSEKTLYIPRQNGRKAPAGFVTVSVLSKEFGRQVLSVRNNSQKSEQQQQSQKHVTVIPKKHCPPDEDNMVRPETPQSLVGSDDENSVQLRNGPVKTVLKSFASRKYYNCEDDGLTGESYKCLPPAEVTGQFQPKMSVNGKNDADLKLFNNHKLSPMIDCSDDLSLDDTTTSSNSSGSGGSIKAGPELLSDLDGNNPLVSFYQKTILTNGTPSSPTKSMELLYNKNAASIDHDYGYSSSTNNNSHLYRSSYRLNTDSLGIQTPSASEPPTDDSEDDSDGSSDRSQYNRISLKYRRCIDTLNGKRREIIKCMPASPKRSRKRRHSPSPDYDDFSNIYCKSDSNSSPEKLYPTVEGSAGNSGGPIKSNQKNHLISSSRISNNGLRLRITTSTTAAMVNSMKAISDLHRMSSPNPLKRKYRKSAANCEGSSGGSSGSKSFTPIERMMHNTNEQVRRVEMRKAFEKLKQLIPNLRDKVKAPKVHILQEAKMYCGQLHYEELKFLSRIEALTQLQEKLRANLSRLRRSAAASRGCIAPA